MCKNRLIIFIYCTCKSDEINPEYEWSNMCNKGAKLRSVLKINNVIIFIKCDYSEVIANYFLSIHKYQYITRSLSTFNSSSKNTYMAIIVPRSRIWNRYYYLNQFVWSDIPSSSALQRCLKSPICIKSIVMASYTDGILALTLSSFI